MEDNCDNISAQGNIKPLGMTEKYAGAMSKLCKALWAINHALIPGGMAGVVMEQVKLETVRMMGIMMREKHILMKQSRMV